MLLFIHKGDVREEGIGTGKNSDLDPWSLQHLYTSRWRNALGGCRSTAAEAGMWEHSRAQG